MGPDERPQGVWSPHGQGKLRNVSTFVLYTYKIKGSHSLFVPHETVCYLVTPGGLRRVPTQLGPDRLLVGDRKV